MFTFLVTGSGGFIGKHLVEALQRRPDYRVIPFDLDSPPEYLKRGLQEADVVFHLAGINRPQHLEEFKTANADFTSALCAKLQELGRSPLFIISSSIQATLDNPYGVSKRQAEMAVQNYARWAERNTLDKGSGSDASKPCSHPNAIIFRLKNVFGKWCRPNYNSVTATFCYNIAHDFPIIISDPNKELELVYIDDVVEGFLAALPVIPPTHLISVPSISSAPVHCCQYREISRTFKVTLGELASSIRAFRESRKTLLLPDFANAFLRALYATYLSYLEPPDFSYSLDQKCDNRGCLAEFIKQPHFGQIFVSRTKPGVTRGNHYHHTKTEKFMVVEGEAIIRFRSIQASDSLSQPIIEHRVSGKDFRVVDIPPGYTHSIENVGATELVTLFWASEIFDSSRADTYIEEVRRP